MEKGIGYRPSRAKSVLLKSSWAVVIEREGREVRGFDSGRKLCDSLPTDGPWLRWYEHIPAFVGENLPSKAVHLWYVKAKKRRIFQGPWQRVTLEITVFLFYNNSMRSRGHIAPLYLIADQKNIEKEVKRV